MKGEYSPVRLFCAAALGLLSMPIGAQVPDPILITEGRGGFTLPLEEGFQGERFGRGVSVIVDLDGNGIRELIVSSVGDSLPGALYVLFLDVASDGTIMVIRNTRIPYGVGPLDGVIGNFGIDVYRDTDGDGVEEILFATGQGLRLMSLSPEGTVRWAREIYEHPRIFEADNLTSQTQGFPDIVFGVRRDNLRFLFPDNVGYRVLQVDLTDLAPFTINSGETNWGRSMAIVGDVNGDGYDDLAVGTPNLELTKLDQPMGAIWIFFLKPLPTDQRTSHSDSVRTLISDYSIIRTRTGPMSQVTTARNFFGQLVVAVGDLDGNGVTDIAAPVFDEQNRTWVLFLNERGEIEWKGSIRSYLGGIQAGIEGGLTVIDDLNGDGAPELVYGDPAFEGHGAIWISFELANVSPQITVETVEAAVLGEPVSIKANIRSTVELQAADVSVRPAGSPSGFSIRKMKKLAGSFDFEHTIPAFFLGEGGLEYFITTEKPTGRHPFTGWLSLPTRHPEGMTLPNVEQTGTDYELISVPLVLDSTNARANFEDDLGPYDISEWRLFELDHEVWKELGTRDIEIVPGKALALRRSDINRVVRTASGQTVPTDQPFLTRLERGWNLVGNPFTFDIPLRNLSLASDAPVELWAYDSTWSEETDAMEAFAGYAIFYEREAENRFDTLWVNADLSPVEDDGSTAQAPTFASTAERRVELEALFAQLTERIEPADRALITNLQNYPNPFRHSTTIRYDLLEDASSTLRIFDALGRLVASVANGSQKAGTHEIVWDGRNNAGVSVSNGTYFYKLTVGEQVRSGKLVLIE